MIQEVLSAIWSIGPQYNRDHLDFVTSLLKIENAYID